MQRFGLCPNLVAEDHVAVGWLRDLLTRGQLQRDFAFCAAGARPLVPDHSKAARVEGDVVAVYFTGRFGAEQSASLPRALLSRRVDVVLVTSSSIATALVDSLEAKAKMLLRDVVVASIGHLIREFQRRWTNRGSHKIYLGMLPEPLCCESFGHSVNHERSAIRTPG